LIKSSIGCGNMGIENLIDKEELRKSIELINQCKIPSPPQLLIDIKKELDSDDVNTKHLMSMIKQDIGLSSSILKLINSSFYNFDDEITSMEQAVTLIGLKNIKDLILPPAYKLALSNTIKGFDKISEYCHLTGVIAEIIAREIETDLRGLFYLAGLFHDVGVIVLACKYPNYIELIEKHQFSPITLPLYEKDKFDITHTSVGVLLAKKWGLPNDVCNAIFLHHQVYGIYLFEVSQATITIAAVLKLASFLQNKLLHGSSNEAHDECGLMYRNAMKELMIDDDMLANIESEIHALNI